jgi:hypothetical protein
MATDTLTHGAWPRVKWGPVIAGVLCAIAIHIVLGLFGAAFGFAAQPADSKALGVGAGVWGLLTPLVASLAGAIVAVRLADERHEASSFLHGALVWAVGLIAGAVFLTGVLGSSAMTAGTALSGNVGPRAVERRDTPANRARAEAKAEDAAKSAAAGSGAAGLAALMGLGGALAGAALGRRMLTGRGLRSPRDLFQRGHGERAHHAAESGVAYTDRTGVVTTRPPGHVDRTDDLPHQHH